MFAYMMEKKCFDLENEKINILHSMHIIAQPAVKTPLGITERAIMQGNFWVVYFAHVQWISWVS